MKLSLQKKLTKTNPRIVSFRQKYTEKTVIDYYSKDETSFRNKSKFVMAGTFFDFLRTDKQIQSRELCRKVIIDCAYKIDKQLKEKGYEPCSDFVLSSALLFDFGRKIGGKYLPALEKIVISPNYASHEKELEFLVLHEQSHFLHHQKMKSLGLSFKPKQLEPQEKLVITDFYKNLLKNNESCSDKDIQDAIKCYTENDIEFVGYYFTFKNHGINFPENINKIYKKYNGP